MITLEEYYMGRDRAYDLELTHSHRFYADQLLSRVNDLLNIFHADHGYYPGVRSGWRPASVNAVVPHASKKSKHITCQAIDLADNSGTLKQWTLKNLNLCERYGIWVESPEFTPTWVHWQSLPPKSGHRVFIP